MAQPKFPFRLTPVVRQQRTAGQDLVFARRDLECAARMIGRSGHPAIVAQVQAVMATMDALGLPDILPIGCDRCNGEVPAHDPDLTPDRLCRSCADDYDRAAAERRQAIRASRVAMKEAA